MMDNILFEPTDKETWWSRVSDHIFGHPIFATLPEEIAEEAAWFYLMLLIVSRRCGAGSFLIHAGLPLTLPQLAGDLRTTPEHLADQITILTGIGLMDQPAEAYIVYDLPPAPPPAKRRLYTLCLSLISFLDTILDRRPNRLVYHICIALLIRLDTLAQKLDPSLLRLK